MLSFTRWSWGSSLRRTRKGLAGLEGMVTLPRPVPESLAALFGTPLCASVYCAEGNDQFFRDRSPRAPSAAQSLNPRSADKDSWTPQPDTLRFSIAQTGLHPFLDQRTLKLGHRADYLEH